jgi:hypothetical protein
MNSLLGFDLLFSFDAKRLLVVSGRLTKDRRFNGSHGSL